MYSRTQLKYEDEQNSYSPRVFGASIITEDTEQWKKCVYNTMSSDN